MSFSNPFSPPKVSTPTYVPPPVVTADPAEDAESQSRARAVKRRAQEMALAQSQQNVYTSGSGVSSSATVGKTTLG